MKGYRKSWLVVVALCLALLVPMFLVSPPFRAAGPWYVAPGGDDSKDCQSPAAACATIDGALNKPGFVAGDTVLVAVGVYSGDYPQVVLVGKDVTLSGGWDSGFTTQVGASTIDGQESNVGIHVNAGVTATVEHFAVRNGYGAGIDNAGTLTLNHTSVSGNAGMFAAGGIYNVGTVTLNSSVVSGNVAEFGNGGGIYNLGTVTLNSSAISGNAAQLGSGGGIYSEGTLTLHNSAVSDNTARYGSGGIFSYGGTAVLNNSTVSGNSAEDVGGIGSVLNHATLILNSSTISGNRADRAGGILSDCAYGDTCTAVLRNTILAGNIAAESPNCLGTIGSDGYNLVGDTSGCTFAANTGDLINADPELGPLSGSPAYHVPRHGSPAIDAGDPAGCFDSQDNPLLVDQRGNPRVGRCDIGAVEIQSLDASSKAASRSAALPGTSITYTIALRNTGDAAVSNVLVTDTLPSLLTYSPGTLHATGGAYGYSDGTITWSGDIGAGGSVDISFAAGISDGAPLGSSILNTAVISTEGVVIACDVSVKVDGRICNVAKDGRSPVLSTGPSGSWDDHNVWGPAVLRVEGTYMMWYSGNAETGPAGIGLATSADGIHWTKEAANPVLVPSYLWDVAGVTVGTVISDSGWYKMWYTAHDSFGVLRIGHAWSKNGVDWAKQGGIPALDVGSPGDWDGEDVSAPTVIKEGDAYHLWYTGYDGVAPRIGHATSTNGTDWTRDPANPVLGLGQPGEWDWLEVYGPSVVKVGNRYVLWYSGLTLPQAWQTGYAESTDGSQWVRGEMVIPEGVPGAFDDGSADYAYVLLTGTRFGIWYSGYDESKYTIGYATGELCNEPSVVTLPHAVYMPAVLRGAHYCPAYYSDSFDNPTSGWPVGDNAERSYGYVGGQYQIWLKQPSWGWMVTPGAKATDFAVAASAHRANGSRGSYGFIFGLNADWSEYYEAVVDLNYYSIWRYDHGEWTPVQNWTPSDHIRTGTDWNRLKVIRDGATIAFYVNNHHLTTVHDASWMGFKRIGLVAYAPEDGPVDVRFDDFALYPADCGPKAAGADFEIGEPGSHETSLPPGWE